ncbi:MAG: hypothetical protein DMG06_06565 [Acidobacteria bacterium]|nr:MAG: hypothetical protein DMG06_06565 [Acidobacteriota bacterium]
MSDHSPYPSGICSKSSF